MTTTTITTEKINAFAETLLTQRRERLRADYPNSGMAEAEAVRVYPGRVYTKVDVGPLHNLSGKYMVEHATGVIYGIKAYGKVHKGHQYGTLDTIDAWDWSGYVGVPRPLPVVSPIATAYLNGSADGILTGPADPAGFEFAARIRSTLFNSIDSAWFAQNEHHEADRRGIVVCKNTLPWAPKETQ